MESVKRAVASAAEKVKPASQEATAAVGQPSAPDAMWAAMMIPHHRTGIEMAALATERAASEQLRQLAASSKSDQEKELPRLQEIIDAAGKTAMPPEAPVERMNRLHMQVLGSLSGTEFDRHWITVVNGHHMSAVMMTDVALAGSQSDVAKSLQTELRQDQLKEMDELNRLLEQIG